MVDRRRFKNNGRVATIAVGDNVVKSSADRQPVSEANVSGYVPCPCTGLQAVPDETAVHPQTPSREPRIVRALRSISVRPTSAYGAYALVVGRRRIDAVPVDPANGFHGRVRNAGRPEEYRRTTTLPLVFGAMSAGIAPCASERRLIAIDSEHSG